MANSGMRADVESWLMDEGHRTLRKIGITRGQAVLDFGCGDGVYSVPAARVVGSEGRVVALDRSADKLKELTRRARSFQLGNIETVLTSGELKLSFPEEHFDVVLLYDILHHYYFALDERSRLLSEIHRVLRPDALLSVYPEHMNVESIKTEIEATGFVFAKDHRVRLIHEERYTRVRVLNFTKPVAS